MSRELYMAKRLANFELLMVRKLNEKLIHKIQRKTEQLQSVYSDKVISSILWIIILCFIK